MIGPPYKSGPLEHTRALFSTKPIKPTKHRHLLGTSGMLSSGRARFRSTKSHTSWASVALLANNRKKRTPPQPFNPRKHPRHFLPPIKQRSGKKHIPPINMEPAKGSPTSKGLSYRTLPPPPKCQVPSFIEETPKRYVRMLHIHKETNKRVHRSRNRASNELQKKTHTNKSKDYTCICVYGCN